LGSGRKMDAAEARQKARKMKAEAIQTLESKHGFTLRPVNLR